MSKKVFFRDFSLLISGSVLFSLSVNIYAVPNGFVQGGLTGISIMLNRLFSSVPVGTAIFVMNIPLLVIAYMKLGKSLVKRTAVAIPLSSLFIDIGAAVFAPYRGDNFLASVFCGVFAGAGLALIMLTGATTGGTELIASLIIKNRKDIPIGRMILIVDLIIIAASYFVYRSAETVMYAATSLFVSAKVIDFILGGAGRNKMMITVTEKPEETGNCIFENIGRGVTVIKAKGGYTKKEKSLVFCVARAGEIARLNRLLKGIDPDSFTVTGDVGEVMGNGF